MTNKTALRSPSPAIDVIEAIGDLRVLPVLTIEDAESAPDLVSALVAGGLPIVEITLRTGAALDALNRAATEVTNAVVGAGSVVTSNAAATAIDAGARFIVSPGLDEGVIATCQKLEVPVIPGIATASELLRATVLGVDVVKLFPAEVVGGADLILALSAVWPHVRFVPTGGVSSSNARRYLALPQVLAVGGSWMVSSSAVMARDWVSIAASARAALELTRELP